MTQKPNLVPNLAIGLRVLSRLLAYPDSDLRSDLPDMRTALQADGALSAGRKEELYALMRKLETGDPLRNESEFVELFDRGRALRCTCSSTCMAIRAIAVRR